MSYKPLVDRGEPDIGNSPGGDNRGRIHTKVSNKTDEPLPIAGAVTTDVTGYALESTQESVLITAQSIDSRLAQADIDLSAITGLISDTNTLLKSVTGNIDTTLSSRASEATLLVVDGHVVQGNGLLSNITGHITSIDAHIDTSLSTRASEATLQSISGHVTAIDTHIDVNLSTRATEATLSAFKTANHTDLGTVNTSIGVTNTSVQSIDGKLNSLGQKTMSASVPVAIASDQSAVPIQQVADTYQLFSVAGTFNMAVSATDNPLILIKNPLGSGKTIKIWGIFAGTSITNVEAEYKIFANPTVTVNGTAQTIQRRRIGDTYTSIANVFGLPTVSSAGSQLNVYVNGQNNNSVQIMQDFSISLLPNNAALITGNPSSNNRTSELTLVWAEI